MNFLRTRAIEADRVQEELRAALAAMDKENALLRHKLDDHVKRTELWGQRWWSLVPLLVGAVMSLASGLVLLLARK